MTLIQKLRDSKLQRVFDRIEKASAFCAQPWLLALVVSVFVITGIYLALKIRTSISPDEDQHVALSLIMAKQGGFFFKDTPETIYHGPWSRLPILYHWLMARFFAVSLGESPMALWPVRIVNLGLGLLSFYLTWKMTMELVKDRLIASFATIALLSVPMYTFLFSFVSYDNLSNLCAVAFHLFGIRALNHRSVQSLFWSLTFLGLGCLSKVTILPLIPIGFVLLLIFLFRGKFSKGKTAGFVTSLVVFLVVFSLNVNLYGVNYIRYHTLTPICEQVLDPEQCAQHNLESRREPEYVKSRLNAPEISPYRFVRMYYRPAENGILGIAGHKAAIMQNVLRIPFHIVLFLGILGFAWMAFHRKLLATWTYTWVCVSIFFHSLVVLYQHHLAYMKTGEFLIALQGRYHFAIFAPLICLISIGFIHLLSAISLRKFCLVIALILFLIGGNLWTLKNIGSDWYLGEGWAQVR